MERFGRVSSWRTAVVRAVGVVVAIAAVSLPGTAVQPTTAHASPCGDVDGPCGSPMRASGTAPVVSGINPAHGPTSGGTVVSVSGSGFTGATLVTFGGVPGTSVSIVNDGLLTVTSPASYPRDVVVQVANDGGSSPDAGFVFYYAPAALLSVSDGVVPSAGGVVRTFGGFGFLAATGVLFDGVPGTGLNVINDTTLEVTVPAHAPGYVSPKVVTPAGAGLQWLPMLYVGGGPPAVDSVLPAGGPASGGTSVTITGSGFSDARWVMFDGVAVAFSVSDDATIVASAPGHAAGSVPVMVSGITGTSLAGPRTVYTYDLPAVTGLVPSSGPTVGGTPVLIAGIGFTGASTVSFDGIPATGVTVNSDMSITATAPAHATGLAAVTVTTPYGTSPAVDTGYNQFEYADAVRVESVSPSWGGPSFGGTTVTLTGKGFTSATSVTFGGNAGTALSVVNDGLLTVKTPATSAGLVPIVVTSPSGTSGGVPMFSVSSSPPPAVVGLEPDAGPSWGGNTVVIHGRGLASVTSVTFGGVPATIQSTGNTWVYAVAPPHAAGPVNVVVTSANGSSATGAASTYGYGRPRIFGGPAVIATAGQRIWLYGEGFTGTSNVTFDGVSGTSLTVQDDHTLSVDAPAHSTGLVGVVVSGSFGANTIPYVVPYVPIGTIGASPVAGPAAGGTTVSIFGSGFTGASSVTFGGVPGTGLIVGDDSQLVVVTPAHALGTVPVMVTSPAGTAGAHPYTYLPSPTVTNVSPATGSTAGGTTVTITGTNLSALVDVTFGGASGSALGVHSDTEITATTPAHAAGAVDVIVTTTAGPSATGPAAQFTYTQDGPVVSQIWTRGGPVGGGTSVGIYGTGFSGATGVTFGGVPATSEIVNDGYIAAVSPAHAVGTVDVVVTSAAGNSAPSSTSRFSYGTPWVGYVTPGTGPWVGGTAVMLSGGGFTGTTAVAFDGVPAASFNVVADNEIQAVTPYHQTGVSVIAVTGAGGFSDQTGEYLFAGIASVNHGFQHVSIGVPTTIVFTLGAGTTCYNDPDDPGTDTDVDCTVADLSLSPGVVMDFAVTPAPLTVGGTLVTVTFASNTSGSGSLGLRGPLQVPGINTTQFGQWFNWAAIAPELRHVSTAPAGQPVTGGGAAGQAGIADNGSAVVTRVRGSRNTACTVVPGTGIPGVLGFVPAVIPLTNAGQVVLTTGGGYDGPQPVGPQSPTFTDVYLFTGDFSNGGLPGATCISWTSTGAGQQTMSITYTGYDSATNSVLWDSDGDGNGLGLPYQPLVTEWSVLEKVRMPTTSSPADPVNGPSPSIALALALNPGTGLYELNLPGAQRAFDAVALGSHLNAASARFDSWLAGAAWTVALGPGSCGELTGTTSGVTSLTPQGIAGNPLHAVFTAGSALGNNCTPSSTATIVFTANEPILGSSQIFASDTLTITFTAPVTHKYVLLAWAGQRVVLEHDWRTPAGDTAQSGAPVGACPFTAPDNVIRYVLGAGPGSFAGGLGATVVSPSEVTVEVTGSSQAGDIPASPQDACISRAIFESEDPGQVDVEAFPDGILASKAAWVIFYMKYDRVSLSFVTGVSKQYHNSSSLNPQYSPGNPWSLLNDSASNPISWNVSRDLLVRGRVKGWFVNENPSGRPQDATDALNVLPANRWVMPDDWALIAGGPADDPGGTPVTGTAETFRPYYDIMFGPNNEPGMALGDIYGLTGITVARVVADVANTATTFRVTSTSNIVPGSAIFIGPPFVLAPVLSIASSPPRVTLTGPLSGVPAGGAEIALPTGGLSPFEGPYSTLDIVVGGGNTPAAGSLATSGPVVAGAAPSNLAGFGPNRETAVGDGDINWWDAPMPPALVSVKIRGSGYLKLVWKHHVYYGGTLMPNYPNPYYVTNIPGSPFLPAVVPGGGYSWDSWGNDGPRGNGGAWASAGNGANGMGPYSTWNPLPAFLSAATQGTNAAGVADGTLSPAEVAEIAAIRSASSDATAARDLVVYSDNHGEFMVTANGDFKLTLAGCDTDPVGGGKWCDRNDIVGTGTVSAVAEYPDFRGKHFTVASNTIAANWTWGGYTDIVVHPGDSADVVYLVVHTLDRDGACAPQTALGAYSLHPALSWLDAVTLVGSYDVVSAASFFMEQQRATIAGQSGGGTIGAGSFSATGVQFYSVQSNEPGTTGIAEFPLSALAAPGQTDECQAWVRVQKGAQVPDSALISFATDEGTLAVDRVLFNPAPAAPQNVVATAVAGPGMQVTWTDASPGSTIAFAVYRWKWGLGNPVELAGVVPASQLSLVDPGLNPSTLYYYWVVAANTYGGTWSAAAHAVTLGGPPSAPTGLTAAGVNQSSVHIQWNDTSNNELGFIIFRSTGGSWDIVEWLPAGTTSYDDVGRNPNTFYFYWVWSWGWNGAAPSSSITLALTFP